MGMDLVEQDGKSLLPEQKTWGIRRNGESTEPM